MNLIDSSDPDVIIGSETWLRKDIFNSEIFPPGYTTYRKDREDGYGGVLIAVKDNFISEKLDVPSDTDSVYIRIALPKSW